MEMHSQSLNINTKKIYRTYSKQICVSFSHEQVSVILYNVLVAVRMSGCGAARAPGTHLVQRHLLFPSRRLC